MKAKDKEKTVLDAIERIIASRKAAHRVPECAPLREIDIELERSGFSIDRHAVTRHLMNLVKTDKLEYERMAV